MGQVRLYAARDGYGACALRKPAGDSRRHAFDSSQTIESLESVPPAHLGLGVSCMFDAAF